MLFTFCTFAPHAAYAATVIFLTSGTTWTVPSDWTNTNTIEVIGGGAAGRTGSVGNYYGGGGGGGAYSKSSNLTLTPGASVTVRIGSGGAADTAGGDTIFNGTGTTCDAAQTNEVCAKGGGVAAAGAGNQGSGGSSGSGVGTTKYSGGAGFSNGGGGGGAAGPNGAGGNATGYPGAQGGNGTGGAGGASYGNAGSAGIEWDATHGSGGGGAGVSFMADGIPGGAGGLYGGAGGGGGAISGKTAPGIGKQGLIVVTYTAYVPFTHTTVNITTPVTVTGNTSIVGAISKGSGTFVIDDPLDPLNKLLYHSFVESPDALDIYDGIATLDKNGEATIDLPNYFLALNKDFNYLGTPIGQPMPNLYLSKGVHRVFFGVFGRIALTISGGAPNGRVSWQVTGVRHDPFIEANPIVPEVWKGPGQLYDRGQYQCPECYQ